MGTWYLRDRARKFLAEKFGILEGISEKIIRYWPYRVHRWFVKTTFWMLAWFVNRPRDGGMAHLFPSHRFVRHRNKSEQNKVKEVFIAVNFWGFGFSIVHWLGAEIGVSRPRTRLIEPTATITNRRLSSVWVREELMSGLFPPVPLGEAYGLGANCL